jgi:integrase
MSITRSRDGIYTIRWYADGTKGGRYKQLTLGRVDRDEAERVHAAKLAEAAARRAAKFGTTDEAVTFAALAAYYLSGHGPSMAASSLDRAERIIKLHLGPALGNRRAVTLKRADFSMYRNSRLAAGADPSTVNREVTVARAILNFAESEEIITRNSALGRGKVRPLATAGNRLVFFEPDEWRRFIAAFDDAAAFRAYVGGVRRLGPVKIGAAHDTPRRFGGGRLADSDATAERLGRLRETVPVFKALLFTGSRLNEILELTWQDVDLTRGVIRIPQPKAKRAKTIPISAALREVLDSLAPGIAGAAVFRRANGQPFTASEVQRAFRLAQKLSGIRPELTPHSLRHTFASWLAIEGTPVLTIAQLLGHADIRQTIRYAHLSPLHLATAVETIAAVAAGSAPKLAPKADDAESTPDGGT